MGKKDKGSKTDTASTATESSSVGDLLGLKPGPVDLAALDPAETPGFNGSKADAPAATEALAPELGELQERLYASSRMGDTPAKRILMVLQGMDTSGKGGVIRHAIGMVDPQGVRIKAFKAPTEEERAQHYLSRIEKEVPPPGTIGIFDRSQYEDVLIVRVKKLVEEAVWSERYDEINAFEERLAADDTIIIKCFLHISADERPRRRGQEPQPGAALGDVCVGGHDDLPPGDGADHRGAVPRRPAPGRQGRAVPDRRRIRRDRGRRGDADPRPQAAHPLAARRSRSDGHRDRADLPLTSRNRDRPVARGNGPI